MKRAPLPLLAASLILLASLSGCSRDTELVCSDSNARYTSADSIPPVRIPDGLTPPDETESLRLPPPPGSSGNESAAGACLETPPPFFEERTP